MNKDLIRALNAETRTLKQDNDRKIERDFIRTYWYIFSEDKKVINETLKTAPEAGGTDILELLGICNTCYIKRAKLSEILSFCYKPNKLFKEYVEKMLDTGTNYSTGIYTSGKTSVVITNNTTLIPKKMFMHKMALTKHPDIYWATVESVKDTLKLY